MKDLSNHMTLDQILSICPWDTISGLITNLLVYHFFFFFFFNINLPKSIGTHILWLIYLKCYYFGSLINYSLYQPGMKIKVTGNVASFLI